MRTLGLIRRAERRTAARPLAAAARPAGDEDDVVALRFPALGWREATAFAVAVGTLVVVPDPLRFLSASGSFVMVRAS